MNNYVLILLEIAKYTIPALVVMATSSLIVKRFLVNETQRKQIALMHETQDTTIRLRLQAYERLVLFIERIHPRTLIPRIYQPGMTVRDLQQIIILNINTEFEHNLSQQVYVSKQVWDTVRSVKEQELNMVNTIAQQLDPNMNAKELHARIIDYVLTTSSGLPTDIALDVIHEEAKRVLSYGTM